MAEDVPGRRRGLSALVPALCAAAVALFQGPGAAGAVEVRHPGVEAAVARYVGEQTPGVAVLVARHGRPLHLAGHGLADLARRTPVSVDTLFDLASVSKQMTALAAMLLVREGRLDPEAPVADVLPGFRGEGAKAGRPVRVRHLVHHTSGLPDYLDEDARLRYSGSTTDAQVIDWLGSEPLDRKPGKRFDYSNTGYVVLASVVAAAAGANSLAEVLSARVFGPLGMTATGLVSPRHPERRATGYEGDRGGFTPSRWDTLAQGDGNVFSSIADMARYEAALSDGRLLDAAGMRALVTNGRLDDGRPIKDEGEGYGWGWILEEEDGRTIIASHEGSWMGTAALYYRDLETGLSVIILANGEDLGIWDMADDILDVVE